MMVDIKLYYMIKSVVLIAFLIFFSVQDIRENKISTKIVIIMATFGIALACVTLSKDIIIKSLICGVATGAVAYLTHLLSRGGLGIGDVIILAATGIYIGDLSIILIVFISLIALALFSVAGLIMKKINMKSHLPFIPFLVIGVIAGSLI